MDVFEEVKGIIVDLLEVEPEEVTLEASFRDDLEADSLDLVELLMAFEDKFGAPIPDEDVKTILTVGNAVSYIEKQLAEKG
jgi:acyl carrier protein